LRPARDRLFDWILSLGPKARHNLTMSGLPEPDLSAMGIDTSFEIFAAEKDEHAEAFAGEVARLYGAETGNVVITSGASEAIFLAFSVLGEGARAVVPLPNYPAMFTTPGALGMKVGNRLNPTSVPRGAMAGLTDSNNPTGRILDIGAVEALGAPAKKQGGTVFINETYREFAFPAAPRTHFGHVENVVTCSTMTKFYGLGRLRVGWILADRREARRLLHAKWAISGHNSEYSLWIATQVLRKRTEFVERARQVFSRNAELVRKFVSETEELSAEIGAAPFCLVHYKKGPGSISLARSLLEKKGVLVSPGDFFGAPRAFRLCFTADEATLKRGLDALASFFD
jgi:aspartate/methionine/tyrosine aminotransferase